MNLFDHQRRFIEIVREKPRFAWYAEPGCGKTIGVLAYVSDVFSEPSRTVVVAPKSVVEAAWVNDARHFPRITVAVLSADDRDRRGIIAGDWDILATNPEMFKKYGAELIAAGANRLVFDESSKLKNHESAISKATIAFADRMESVILLSGSPAPNGWHEYWAQVRCIVGPKCRPFYQWCHGHGYPCHENVRVKGGKLKRVIKGWGQTPEQADEFTRKMRSISWALSKRECLDLPPQVDRVIDVRLSADEIDAYVAAREALVLRFQDRRVKINAAAALGKLRQIVGGGVYAEGCAERVSASPAKIAAMHDYLDELGPRTPCLIWFEYRHERDRILAALAERGEESRTIDGETSGVAGTTAADFQAGKFARLVLHPQAAGHGITLHKSSHALYMALNFSFELWEQSRARIHRAGMGDVPATYTIFRAIMGGDDAGRTVDHAMLATVRRKGSASSGILEALRDAGVAEPEAAEVEA